MLPTPVELLAAQSRRGAGNWRSHRPAARSRRREQRAGPRDPRPWRPGPGPPLGARRRGGGGGAVTAPSGAGQGRSGGRDGRAALVGPAAGRQLGGGLVRGQLHYRARHRRVLQYGAVPGGAGAAAAWAPGGCGWASVRRRAGPAAARGVPAACRLRLLRGFRGIVACPSMAVDFFSFSNRWHA